MALNSINIITLITGSFEENCYIVYDENNEAFIVDPGDDANRIIDECEKNNLNAKKIVLTHGHFDHTGAVCDVKAKINAEVLIGAYDFEMTKDAKSSLATACGCSYKGFEADRVLSEGDVINVGAMSFKVMETPGHTKGSICLIGADVIFSGDTLFMGSCGRTDFPGGSYKDILKSLNRLAELEGNYKVYSGHGPKTNLDFERKNNQFMGM